MEKINILLITILIGLAYTASAHELSESGTASMFVHVEPSDNPVIGKPSTINISLKNTESTFSLEKCNCQFIIEQDEKELLSVVLVPAQTPTEFFNVEPVPFTFPSSGEYHLSIVGKPTTENLFAPFELEVHEEVTSDTVNKPTDYRVELIGLAILIISVGYYLSRRNKHLPH